ncbi:hypothetical protein SteCoe_19870 [Stentor coeruleus]|uniref:Uncharacterized protein n=1 Tax=Stentor coeruleus TaxID=5963 RepID=A0A1R2BCV0_9CILI|nr:hypothetical protein SteCoe_26568 [Stentor coeruleus]OMJ79996.1 hypothetical protein SteCoe_19870 [Stentor coeruleus]
MSKFNVRNLQGKKSLEGEIEKLHVKIKDFKNNSLLSSEDSEILSPTKENYKKKCLDDTELSLAERFLMMDDCFGNYDIGNLGSEELNTLCNRAMMKYEDFRSFTMRKSTSNDFSFSEVKSSFEDDYKQNDVKYKEITLKDIYGLLGQLKNIILIVESKGKYIGSFKFAGFSFNLSISDLGVIEKDIYQKQLSIEQFVCKDYYSISDNECNKKVHDVLTEDWKVKGNTDFYYDVVDRFCKGIESQMINTYNDMIPMINNKKDIMQDNIRDMMDMKSWCLLEQGYRKLKAVNEKCEEIKNDLAWKNTEMQVIKLQAQKKIQENAEKEIELKFKQEDIYRLQEEYEKNLRDVKASKAYHEKEIEKLDVYKEKLENMRVMIKTQLEALSKIHIHTESKRPNSASKINYTTSTSNHLNQNSTQSTSPHQNEINHLQQEISTLEKSLKKSPNEENFVKLSHLLTKLSDLKTQKALDQFSSNTSYIQTLSSISNQSTSKLSVPKRIISNSAQNSPTNMSMKSFIIPSSEHSNEVSKPPIYKKATRMNSENVENTKSLCLREERVVEREIELDEREKGLQKMWKSMSDGEKLISIINDEKDKLARLQMSYDNKLKVLQSQIIRYDNIIEKAKEQQAKVKTYPDETVQKLKSLYKLMGEFLL